MVQFSLYVHKGGLKPYSFHPPPAVGYYDHQMRAAGRAVWRAGGQKFSSY